MSASTGPDSASSAIALILAADLTIHTLTGPPAVSKKSSFASGGGGQRPSSLANPAGIINCGVSASYPLLTRATTSLTFSPLSTLTAMGDSPHPAHSHLFALILPTLAIKPHNESILSIEIIV
jgi:hypothetical protein